MGENKIVKFERSENFDNKSVYFIKNPHYFPDIDKKRLKTTKPFVGSAVIIGSNFRKESYPQLASSLQVGATAAVTILPFICCLNNITCI